MTEALLQFIWRYQLLNDSSLLLSNGIPLNIKHPGYWNNQSGPDFLSAQIEYDNLLWNGAVEIHLKSTHWYAHGHQQQAEYDTVILHVVWEHDLSVVKAAGDPLPTLELKKYVTPEIIAQYQNTFNSQQRLIPCGTGWAAFPDLNWKNYSIRLFVERLEQQTQRIFNFLAASKNDWEAVCFQLLARNFGLNRNGAHFQAVAAQLPFGVVRKVRPDLEQLEALFMGQSGLLQKTRGNYCAHLQQQYCYLKRKFKLPTSGVPPEFLRLRPSNFPTLRWAQLARLYHESEQLFQAIIAVKQPKGLQWMRKLAVSAYWQKHFNFEEDSLRVKKSGEKKLSLTFFNLLCINTFIPLRFAYRKALGRAAAAEDAVDWMEQLPAEQNSILKKYQQLGRGAQNALESQSILHLHKMYCKTQKCLQCTIGYYLMQAQKK